MRAEKGVLSYLGTSHSERLRYMRLRLVRKQAGYRCVDVGEAMGMAKGAMGERW